MVGRLICTLEGCEERVDDSDRWIARAKTGKDCPRAGDGGFQSTRHQLWTT